MRLGLHTRAGCDLTRRDGYVQAIIYEDNDTYGGGQNQRRETSSMRRNVIYGENDIYEGTKESMTENDIYAGNVIYAAARRSVRRRASRAGSPAACRGPARTPVDSIA